MSLWTSGDSLTPSTLNQKMSSAASSAGYSTNTVQAESGNTIIVQSVLSVATLYAGTVPISALDLIDGAALNPSLGYQSEQSLGFYRSAVSNIALSYGTMDVPVLNVGQRASVGTLLVESGTATEPRVAFLSERSLGLYRSAASTLALSYGTFQASGLSGGNVRAPAALLQADDAQLNYRTAAATERWTVGLNFGGYASDELVIQDRLALNTGVCAFVSGAGFVVGQAGAQLNRSATSGFIYISSTTGAPTGTPAAVTGKVPLFYDTGTQALWVYASGSWRSIAAI